MADDPQTGDDPEPFNPFGAMGLPFDLSQVDMAEAMRILQSPGPLNWEIARQVAEQVALEEAPSETITDTTRAELNELAHAAAGPVVTETGLTDILTLPVEIIDRRTWVHRHLDRLKPVLETLATTMQDAMASDLDAADDAEVEAATAGMLGMPLGAEGIRGLMGMLGPLLLGAQTGSMIGYLAQHALGCFDLPLPSIGPPTITFVAPNIDRFADDWSIEPRDVRLAVAIAETVRAAQRTQPWVRERLVAIATEYVGAFELDPRAFDEAFGDVDPTDADAMAQLAQRPDVLLGALRSERQRAILERNQQFTMVLEGHADLVTEQIGTHLLTDYPRIHEALRRHHVERGEAGRFVEGMLGIELDRSHYERGQAFCAGVVERAGMIGLNRIWSGPELLPTPAELDAPGLWLARIDLPELKEHRVSIDTASEIRTIGVLGAGVMGGGIAQVCATAGYDVVVYDIDPAALTAGREHATTGRYGLDSGVARGLLTRADADGAVARLTFSEDFAAAAATDLVIEAVPERLDLKIRVFRDLDAAAPPHAILCSNSSGFPIQAIGAATNRPEQVVGWHWASPAPVMKLAEIVRTRATSDATVATVTAAALRCGKHPVVVQDTAMAWGYVANRVYFAMVAEAQKVVDEGIATADEVDQLMTDCYRWPAGPFGMVKGAGSGWS